MQKTSWLISPDSVSTSRNFPTPQAEFLTQTLGKQISYRNATVDGHAGKLLIYNTPSAPRRPEMHGQAYFVLVGTRLYVISAVVSNGDPESKAKRFLSSVQLD